MSRHDFEKLDEDELGAFFRALNPLHENDWCAEQVARAKWLHIVTANHLRKARKTIRELRFSIIRLEGRCINKDALIDAYRGQIGRDKPFGHVPEHYRGDGYVSCDRAIESAAAQRCIAKRTPLQFWYWATAIKYVWRMWSKEDPELDARKAIDCLEKAAGLGIIVRATGEATAEVGKRKNG